MNPTSDRRKYYKRYNRIRYATPEARTAELARSKAKYWRLVRGERFTRKLQLILVFGGQCQKCGYNRSAAALDFHHRNPKSKQKTVSHLLALNNGWLRAVQEAKHCDLLCANCHREETFPDLMIVEKPPQKLQEATF